MIFAIEPLENCWNEFVELAVDHWAETEGYRHSQPLSPKFDRYSQYAKAGWFLMFTARDDGELVGYAGMYIVPSMHTQMLIATEDSWFLLPGYRKGWNAVKFYKFIEKECFARGAVEITMTAKLTNTAGRLLLAMGYNEISKQYSKSADSAVSNQLMEPENVRTLTTASA